MWTTNVTLASKSSAFRSLFLTKSRKQTSPAWIINLTSVTAVAQCATKYKITHSPLRSITTFRCFADMHTIWQRHNKGKSVQVECAILRHGNKSVHKRFFVTISTVQSVEIAKTASLLQLHRLSSSYHNMTCGLSLQLRRLRWTLLKCRFLVLSVKTDDGLH